MIHVKLIDLNILMQIILDLSNQQDGTLSLAEPLEKIYTETFLTTNN
jgi:hypothetical protein